MSAVDTATLSNGSKIKFFTEERGSGLEKVCFFAVDQDAVVLLYRHSVNTDDPNRLQRLEFIVDRYSPVRGDHAQYWGEHFCWPTAIVTSPRLGIVTPKYPPNFFFPTTADGKFYSGQEKNGRWFSGAKSRKRLPREEQGDWLGYLRLGTKMARAARRMHAAGLAHSDLSNKNVLVDPVSGSAILIDIDTLVVPNLFPPKVLGTKGYQAPEVVVSKAQTSRETDLHALAVLLYEYLLLRHPLVGPKIHQAPSSDAAYALEMGEKALFIEHPSDHSNRPHGFESAVKLNALGEYLEPLFIKAFVDGLHNPPARPTANNWETALYRTTDILLPCSNASCEQKWYPIIHPTDPTCPWCRTRYGKRVPVLNLYYAHRAGTAVPQNRRLATFNGWGLHSWQTFFGVSPGDPSVDRKRLAHVVEHQGRFYFRNEHLLSLRINGEDVPIGDHRELAENMTMQFGTDSRAMAAQVQIFGR
jgi:hypothetical protein